MKKMVMMLLLGVSAVLAEQVPEDVQLVIDNAINGKYPISKEFIQDNLPASGIKAGRPFHFYWFDNDSIAKLDEKAPICSMIKPIDQWAVPLITPKNKIVLMELVKNPATGKWHVAGYGMSGYAHRWERVCKKWPDSLGYHPIFIGRFAGTQFYYTIPEKDCKNLTDFRTYGINRDKHDSLFLNLDSSRVIIKKMKSEYSSHFTGDR